MSVTYDLSPGVTMAPGVDLELPEDEALWESTSEGERQATRGSIQSTGYVPGLKAAWNFLAFGKGLDPFGANCTPWSTFSVLAVIHLVINHMWYLSKLLNISQFLLSIQRLNRNCDLYGTSQYRRRWEGATRC
jgi:hypothetical protein